MIKKRNLIFIIMFIPFMLELNFLIPITSIYGVLVRRIILADAVIILFYNLKRLTKCSAITKCILLFCTLVFIFTCLNHNSLFVALYYSTTLGGFAVLIDMQMREDPVFVAKFVTRTYGMILIMTLCFQLLAPTAFGVAATSGNNYNFWVSDNEMGYVYIPLMVASACADYWKNNRLTKKTAVLILISLLSVLLAWSGTCVIGMLIMTLGFVLAVLDIKNIDFRKLFTIAVVLSLGILVFRIQDIFSEIIVGFLHKDLTFTGRIYAWDLAIKRIVENMFVGYGTINGGRLTIFDVWANTDSVSAHSYILEITLQGGLVGLGAIVSAYIVAGSKLLKNKDTQLCIFISFAVFAMLIMYITEGWVYHTFQYIILYFAYYAYSFINKEAIEC